MQGHAALREVVEERFIETGGDDVNLVLINRVYLIAVVTGTAAVPVSSRLCIDMTRA